MGIRCRMGLHGWFRWTTPKAVGFQCRQYRTCCRCGLAEMRVCSDVRTAIDQQKDPT